MGKRTKKTPAAKWIAPWLDLVEGAPDEVTEERVIRFVSNVLSSTKRDIDRGDEVAAAALLNALLNGAAAGDNLNVIMNQVIGVKKTRVKAFDPTRVTYDDDAWEIVNSLALGQITRQEAIEAFRPFTKHVTDSARGKYIDALRPRAEREIIEQVNLFRYPERYATTLVGATEENMREYIEAADRITERTTKRGK